MRRASALVLIVGCSWAVHAPLPAETPRTGTTQIWTGFVTDTHCGTHCQLTSHMTPDRACVRRCVQQGSLYGLWVGDRVYPLLPQARAAHFAAANVRVTGALAGRTIHIQTIAPVPNTQSSTAGER
jgi:hypothetical protein